MNPKERKNKIKKNRKNFSSVKNLFSSFAITVGAVVIAATYIPQSPKADIFDLTIFENEVIYQVEVTDEDSALSLDSLKIVLENQFETYTYPLELGLNVGIFENLNSNTPYTLSVYGSKGFGDERLASRKVTTHHSPGGAIVSYTIKQETEFDYSYDIRVLVNGLFDEYQSVQLYYGYQFPDEPLDFYESIEITESDMTLTLENISNYNVLVFLYLEGVNENLEVVRLDELSFPVPFKLESHVYLESLTKSLISYSFYADSFIDDVDYSASIYKDDLLLETMNIEISESMMHYEGTKITFDQLKNNTTYHIKVIANYKDPYTLRSEKQIIYEEDIKTLSNYSINYEVTDYDLYYEVTLDVFDPNHYFQVPYFILYDTSLAFPIYLESMNYSFTPDGTHKYVTFIINKPSVESYEFSIGIRNQSDFYINDIIYTKKITP